MLHQKSFLLICLVCLIKVSFSQNVVAEFAYSDREPELRDIAYSLQDEGMVLCTESAEKGNNNLVLHKYDSKLKEEWQKEVPIPAKQKMKCVLHKVMILGSNIYVFYTNLEKVYKTSYYLYDLKGNLVGNNPNILVEIPDKSFYPRINESNGYFFTYSPNKRSFLVAYDKDGTMPDKREYLYFIFDEDGLRSKGEIPFSYKHNQIDIDRMMLTNIGNIYTQGRTEVNSVIGKEISFRFWLHKWDCETQKATETTIDFEDKFMRESKVVFEEDETAHVMGLIFDKSPKDDKIALAHFKISPDNSTIIERKEMSLPDKLMAELGEWFDLEKRYKSLTQADRYKVYVIDCEVTDIIINDDGTMNVLIEETNAYPALAVSSNFRTAPATAVSSAVATSAVEIVTNQLAEGMYFANFVLSIQVGEGGEITNHSMWKKMQRTNYPELVSVFPAKTEKSNYLFATLSPDILLTGKFKGNYDEVSKQNLYQVTLDNNIISPKKPVITKLKENEYLNRRFSEQVSSNSVIVCQMTSLVVAGIPIRSYYFSKIKIE